MARIAHDFFQHAATTPNKLALWCDGESLSYSQLQQRVNRWLAFFRDNGVTHHDHLGVILPNSSEFVALMLAAAAAGIVLVPVSTSLPNAAVLKTMHSAAARHLVGTRARLQTLQASQAQYPEYGANLQGAWMTLDAPAPGMSCLADFDRLLPDSELEPLAGCDEDAYILTMTSGSTGDPKPILLTQQTKILRAEAAIALYGVTADDRIFASTPLYHSLAERLVLMTFLLGATLYISSRYSPALWLDIVSQQRISFLIAVSSQLKHIAETAVASRFDSSLRTVVSSSALLDQDTRRALLEVLQCDFHECYGASEVAIVSNIALSAARDKVASVGTAIESVALRIIDDQGRDCPTGTIGEIVCQTPMAFSGYYGLPEKTAAAYRDGYFCTGDLGYLDDDGYLYYVGRSKELIITGGINVYPSDIEAVAKGCPGVRDAVAFPMQDAGLGEIPALAVVAQAGFELKPRNLRSHCARELADYQIPRKIFIVDEIPLNEMGKIARINMEALLQIREEQHCDA